ncbi:MAG TPA: PfkB family carbohydrate kinase [Capsulimonadaceae bacterium]|jgi:D-beta-D-heptose 7-phosphate kinase/D-beta-D-heptose 1-phosphate adenosyltransferase
MNKTRASEILSQFPGRRVIVVGDVMLDEYIWGQVNRISPEAPVMVVDAERYSSVPGGAANVVNNLCALGATGAMVGVIGDDAAGRTLAEALQGEGADTVGLVTATDRPTTRKTRIIAHSQQVVRVDHEKRGSVSAQTAAEIGTVLDQLAETADAIILSDYIKGVVSPEVIEACVRISKQKNIPLTGNLKPKTIGPGSALTVLTLNLLEARQATGDEPLDSDEKVFEAGRALLAETGSAHILITRGSNGLTLVSAASPDAPQHVPARPVEVYDVAGAGDTVISALTLALAVGATALEAVTLANHTAAEAVKKVGVATVSPDEILASW